MFTFSFVFSNDTYITNIKVDRKSGVSDIIPIVFTKVKLAELINLDTDNIIVRGRVCTYANENMIYGHRIYTYVMVNDILIDDGYQLENNRVELRGKVTRAPIYRTTPKGKLIVEIAVKIDTSLIHCIGWKEVAVKSNNINRWDIVYIKGRLQSRKYKKNGNCLIAYEVSSQIISKVGTD